MRLPFCLRVGLTGLLQAALAFLAFGQAPKSEQQKRSAEARQILAQAVEVALQVEALRDRVVALTQAAGVQRRFGMADEASANYERAFQMVNSLAPEARASSQLVFFLGGEYATMLRAGALLPDRENRDSFFYQQIQRWVKGGEAPPASEILARIEGREWRERAIVKILEICSGDCGEKTEGWRNELTLPQYKAVAASLIAGAKARKGSASASAEFAQATEDANASPRETPAYVHGYRMECLRHEAETAQVAALRSVGEQQAIAGDFTGALATAQMIEEPISRSNLLILIVEQEARKGDFAEAERVAGQIQGDGCRAHAAHGLIVARWGAGDFGGAREQIRGLRFPSCGHRF